MTTLRARIEHGFERFARGIYRHHLLTLLALLLVTGAMAAQLRDIRFDTSTESFFHEDDPALIDYNTFREQFGRDEVVVVGVAPPDVFDAAFLERLRAFHAALEAEVPHLDEVTSLINVRDTRGEGDTLVVADLVEDTPRTPEALAALKRHTLGSELYPNLLVSESGTFTAIIVETVAFSGEDVGDDLLSGFGETSLPGSDGVPPPGADDGSGSAPAQLLTNEENAAVVAAVEAVVKRFDSPEFPVFYTGSPVVTDFLKRAMQLNMGRFMALAVAAIAVFLLLLFRRFTGVVLPILVVLLSLVSTVGLMALSGVAFKLPLMILPSFLLAVGVGASVHLLAIFFRSYEQAEKEDAVAAALGHSGLPILMTSLTTAAGLLSFVTAALASVADLGMFASIGVLISLVYTLVGVPALLALLPVRRTPRFAKAKASPWADRLLSACGRVATERAWWVVALSTALVVFALLGLPQLRFSHNTLVWFPVGSQVRDHTERIDGELSGSISVEMVIDTGVENGLYDPAFMNRLDALAAYAESYENAAGERFVGKTSSVADVLKEIHRALNENRAQFYRIPGDRELIAQELLLFENSGSDDLERQVDSRFSMARLSIRTPWDDAAAYVRFVQDIQERGETLFRDTATVTTTGLIRLFTQSIFALMNSMLTSYTVAIAVITVLMVLVIGRLGLGLLSMIPNLLPIAVTLGGMGWFGVPLDAFTLLIGSISLGLAVDDTIHFFHNYRRYRAATGNARAAVQETLLSTGRALLFTTLVLVTGFWLFMFATLNNLFFFGLLTGTTLALALLADIVLAPAMMELLDRRWRRAA